VLTPLADDAYRTCLVLGPMTIRQLVGELEQAQADVRHAVSELLHLGLLAKETAETDAVDGRHAASWQQPGSGNGVAAAAADGSADGAAAGERYAARPPRAPLGRLAEQRHRESVETLELASRLGELWREHRDPAPYLEFLETDAESSAAEEQLFDDTRDELLALSIGPVGRPVQRPPVRMPEGFVRARSRGVEFRVVYGTSILRDPAALAAVRTSIRLGEQVRVFPDVPLNLRIADERAALLTVAGRQGERRHALLIHPSGLLDAMVGLFASYWRMAAPLSGTAEPDTGTRGPDAQARRLLALLAAGLTDESIARELGVSERTVGRRIARLQERLGAASRFQLGLQASRQGWL
jgi:DNA-binding CsgD family transcriptional regulator